MLHSAAVKVSFTWCECQSGKLVEGLIFIREISTEWHPRGRMAIFGPSNIDGRWVEVIHKADQAVFYSQLNFVRREEDDLWRV